MIEWPSSLVNDLARRRTVIVIGSGVSRHAASTNHTKPPTWKTFLEKAVEDCPVKTSNSAILEAIKIGDYLHACEWLKKQYDETWVNYLRGVFSNSVFKSAKIHEEILKLDSRIVFSLNFDNIYENHVSSVTGSHIYKSYHDADVAEFLRGNGRYIVKVHGSLNTPTQLIFTQKDYSEARVKNSAFYLAFDAALLTHTFLFIGSGYTDPDVNLLLENQNFGFPSSTPHYFLSSSGLGHERKASLRDNRNLKVLEYEPVDSDHSGLVREIEVLNEKVESERFEIAQSIAW